MAGTKENFTPSFLSGFKRGICVKHNHLGQLAGAVLVAQGDSIGAVLTEIKNRSMPTCAANPISSSSDGMA